LQRKKKPERGDTRAAVDAAKEALKAKAILPPPFPSGLLAGWGQKGKSSAKSADKQVLGRLSDDNASGTQPTSELPAVKSRPINYVRYEGLHSLYAC
jgi:hypothetical protein